LLKTFCIVGIFEFGDFFWVSFAIFGFAILIIISRQSAVAQQRDYLDMWIENSTSINFPVFHFRIYDYDPAEFDSIVCTTKQGLLVPNQICNVSVNDVPPIEKCFAVSASDIVTIDTVDPTENAIICWFNTTANTTSSLVAWEVEGDNFQYTGANSYAATWVHPSPNAWVLLQKSIISRNPESHVVGWHRDLVYQSSLSDNGQFTVSTIISSLQITHYNSRDSFNGWRALGEIGGFAYALVLVHTVVMIIIGFCMTNDSKFLTDRSGSEYESLNG